MSGAPASADVMADDRVSDGDALAEFIADVATDLGVQLRFPQQRPHDGVLTPVVIRRRANALIRLDPLPVVARVANWTASVRDEPADNLRVEVELSRWAASRGLAVPVPMTGAMAGPHTEDGVTFTLWPLADDGAALADPGLAGRALAELHAALAGFPGELPGPDPIAFEANRAMMVLGRMGLLDSEEAMLVADECRELLADLRLAMSQLPAGRLVPLHGDAHARNARVAEGHVTWFDFEDAWRGPVEWDVATLTASDAWTSDRQRELVVRQYCIAAEIELDHDVLTACRRLRNAQMEAWQSMVDAVGS